MIKLLSAIIVMSSTATALIGAETQLEQPIQQDAQGMILEQQAMPAVIGPSNTMTISDPKQITPEELILFREMLKVKTPMEVIVNGKDKTVIFGAQPQNAAESRANMVELLRDLLQAHPGDADLADVSEDYANAFIKDFGQADPNAAVSQLLRQAHANQLGVAVFVLEKNPDFEQFVVANAINRDLRRFGKKVQLSRYNDPMVELNGQPSTLAQIKQSVPVDQSGKMDGWVFSRFGGIISVASPGGKVEQDLEGMRAANEQLQKYLSDRDGQISKLTQDLQARDQEIAKLKMSVSQLEKSVKDKDDAIAKMYGEMQSHSQKVNELTSQLSKANSDLAAATDKIKEREATIESQGDAIDSLNNASAEKDKRISELASASAAKDTRINELIAASAEKDKQIQALKDASVRDKEAAAKDKADAVAAAVAKANADAVAARNQAVNEAVAKANAAAATERAQAVANATAPLNKRIQDLEQQVRDLQNTGTSPAPGAP